MIMLNTRQSQTFSVILSQRKGIGKRQVSSANERLKSQKGVCCQCSYNNFLKSFFSEYSTPFYVTRVVDKLSR